MATVQGRSVGSAINAGFIVLLSLFCLYPFLLMVGGSLTSEAQIVSEGYQLIPQPLDTSAYEYLWFNNATIVQSYLVTIFTTVVGTASALVVTSITAYPLSRKKLKYRNIINFAFFFTMIFNGGIVPWYLVTTQILGLRDNLLALFVPMMFSVWHCFLLRNFFMTIPDSLHESATIDGAGEFMIYRRIVLPLSKAGIATIGLFTALGYWNSWFQPLLLINKPHLFPLQLILRMLQSTIDFLKTAQGQELMEVQKLIPREGVKLATVVVTIGPIIFVYPFVQKYFVKGITIGSIKG